MKRLIPGFIILFFCLLIFEKLAFSDLILARGDTYHYFYPYWDARNEAFRAGELPLWTPDIFMGAPLLADPQIGTFYLPNWLMTPFNAPDGIRYSILLHVFWACLGTFILFRRIVNPAIMPALVAAAVFGLSGYMGAHVEQINQLQGLSWLPWLIYCLHRLLEGERRFLFLLAIAWALQIFSGHTQTTFLSGVALGLYAISVQLSAVSATFGGYAQLKQILFNLLKLACAAIVAVLLAIPQLLPTLELTGMSNRGGGLTANEATAFSLPPWYFGRALLPSYDGLLFGEYIGYIGVIALVLACYGALSSWKHKRLWFWIGLALLGLFFAMGRANFIYYNLAELPGFNFFRVPARWLAFYALGMAMLAGYGLLALQTQLSWKRLLLASLPFALLIPLAEFAPIDPTEITGSANPTMMTYAGWGIAFAALYFSAFLSSRQDKAKLEETPTSDIREKLKFLLPLAVVVELFFASRIMPYNDLAPRDVYLGQRFTISQMLALNEGEIVPPRMLSISGRLFDVGDISSLSSRFDSLGMDEQAQATAFTAIKSQEILFTNLGLSWGIPTIDGYGGGLLPTIYYSQFTSLLLPEGSARTVDGRLGEMMAWPDCRGACIPPLTMLAWTNTRYLIVDKVYDVWIDGVSYDTTFAGTFYGIGWPDFEFTEIRVLHSGNITGEFENQTQIIDDTLRLTSIQESEFQAFMEIFPDNLILAITVVDTRTGDFQALYPWRWSRILSSDIKIYRFETPEAEMTTDNPYNSGNRRFDEAFNRAVLYTDMPPQHIFPDNWQGHEDALAWLNTSQLAVPVLNGDAQPLEHISNRLVVEELRFNEYSATRVSMTVNSDVEAYVLLKDAYYPGWIARVNGEESPIYRANVMFRAVRVPAGESTVVFEFVPRLWYGSMAFGAVVWIIILGVLMWLWRSGHASSVSLQDN